MEGDGLPSSALGTSPLAKHHPVTAACDLRSLSTAPIKMPHSLRSEQPEPWSLGELEKHALELDEWLTLASLQSPRVHHDDQIDPYLCRYSKPDGDPTNAAKLVVLRWSGFIAAEWLRHLFVILM